MAQEGDTMEVFTSLLEAHADDLRAFIAAVVHTDSVRADIYQETARAMWFGFDRYDLARPFGAWARGVARHIVQRHKRQAFRESKVFSPAAIDAICTAWEREEADNTELRLNALRECLERLPPESRRVIDHFYASRDARANDIARKVNRSVTAVYQLLTRARARLSGCIRAKLLELENQEPPP
jgi:RNA polymerase sigma-70 factor, ECF subfamily